MSDKLRDQEHPTVLGYELDRQTLTPIRQYVTTTRPREQVYRPDRYRVGWNDLANGIIRWHPSERWAGPLEWAIEMKAIAQENMRKHGDDGYMAGVVEAANAYQLAGGIGRKD